MTWVFEDGQFSFCAEALHYFTNKYSQQSRKKTSQNTLGVTRCSGYISNNEIIRTSLNRHLCWAACTCGGIWLQVLLKLDSALKLKLIKSQPIPTSLGPKIHCEIQKTGSVEKSVTLLRDTLSTSSKHSRSIAVTPRPHTRPQRDDGEAVWRRGNRQSSDLDVVMFQVGNGSIRRCSETVSPPKA